MSRALSLAGFQVTLIGRFWVTTEDRDVCDGRKSCEHDSTTKNGRDAPKQEFESADSIGHD